MKLASSPWVLLALAGLFLATAALAFAVKGDSQEYPVRHVAMMRSCAL